MLVFCFATGVYVYECCAGECIFVPARACCEAITHTTMRSSYWCWSVHFFFGESILFWCVSAVLVSVFFCIGAGVLFWCWCVHTACVCYDCVAGESNTRAHHHQVRAYWCWSVCVCVCVCFYVHIVHIPAFACSCATSVCIVW